LRSGVPNKNTAARLKSNILPPPKKFWAGYATALQQGCIVLTRFFPACEQARSQVLRFGGTECILGGGAMFLFLLHVLIKNILGVTKFGGAKKGFAWPAWECAQKNRRRLCGGSPGD